MSIGKIPRKLEAPPFDGVRKNSKGRLARLHALRPHIVRLTKLIGRAEDSELALGSDAMVTALEGYAMLKVLGKGSGLDALRRDISAGFRSQDRPCSFGGNMGSRVVWLGLSQRL